MNFDIHFFHFAQLCFAAFGFAELFFGEQVFSEFGFAELGFAELGLAELGFTELGLAELGLSFRHPTKGLKFYIPLYEVEKLIFQNMVMWGIKLFVGI